MSSKTKTGGVKVSPYSYVKSNGTVVHVRGHVRSASPKRSSSPKRKATSPKRKTSAKGKVSVSPYSYTKSNGTVVHVRGHVRSASPKKKSSPKKKTSPKRKTKKTSPKKSPTMVMMTPKGMVLVDETTVTRGKKNIKIPKHWRVKSPGASGVKSPKSLRSLLFE